MIESSAHVHGFDGAPIPDLARIKGVARAGSETGAPGGFAGSN